jgi:hypothetical protein
MDSMKNRRTKSFWLIVVFALSLLSGFGQMSKAGQADVSKSAGTNRPTPPAALKSRLVVSFYSICCGIDSAAKEQLDKFIAQYEKTKRKKLAKAESHWGREGEIDYCFKLSELSRGQQKNFILKVRSLLKNSKLVHINENDTCQSGR